MAKFLFLFSSLLGLSGVMLGASGKHLLKSSAPTAVYEAFETGVRYQFYHIVPLLFIGILLRIIPAGNSAERILRYSGGFFSAGIVLFSLSLYIYAFSGIKFFAHLTPAGGSLLILAWILLAISILKL